MRDGGRRVIASDDAHSSDGRGRHPAHNSGGGHTMQSDPQGPACVEPGTPIAAGLETLMRAAHQAGLHGVRRDGGRLSGEDPGTGVRCWLPDVAAVARLAGIAWA